MLPANSAPLNWPPVTPLLGILQVERFGINSKFKVASLTGGDDTWAKKFSVVTKIAHCQGKHVIHVSPIKQPVNPLFFLSPGFHKGPLKLNIAFFYICFYMKVYSLKM